MNNAQRQAAKEVACFSVFWLTKKTVDYTMIRGNTTGFVLSRVSEVQYGQ